MDWATAPQKTLKSAQIEPAIYASYLTLEPQAVYAVAFMHQRALLERLQ